MKISTLGFLVFCLTLATHKDAYAVMFPQEVEQELAKERATKTDEWENLEQRHSEIMKKISELEQQEKEYFAALENVKKDRSVEE